MLLVSLASLVLAVAGNNDCWLVVVNMLVGSVVETVSISADEHDDNSDDVEAAALTGPDAALAAAAAAACFKGFVVEDDVSAGVWVVVRAAVTFAAVVTIFEHIVDPRMDGVQNVFSLSALGEETST